MGPPSFLRGCHRLGDSLKFFVTCFNMMIKFMCMICRYVFLGVRYNLN